MTTTNCASLRRQCTRNFQNFSYFNISFALKHFECSYMSVCVNQKLKKKFKLQIHKIKKNYPRKNPIQKFFNRKFLAPIRVCVCVHSCLHLCCVVFALGCVILRCI